MQRLDDNEETVSTRLTAYEQLTAPLIQYFGETGRLLSVSGDRAVNEVFAEIGAALER